MRTITTALAVAAATALAVAATATAAPPPVQTAQQSAGSSQSATAASGAIQSNPSNTNISIRVLSPGDDGAVTQTNSAASSAAAGNANDTSQSTDQTQAGGSGIQTATQAAMSAQLATALSYAAQLDAANANAPTSVSSPGSGGSTAQSNGAASTAGAGNANGTDQSSSQAKAGSSCGCAGSPGVQTSDQGASNRQSAAAGSSATQSSPSNTNVAIRVLSPGNDGAVTQSNTAASRAGGANDNATDQASDQTQAGGGAGIQTGTQRADSTQSAGALSQATQSGASNTSTPVRVGSPGNGGSVTQSNTAASSAGAENRNDTDQSSAQNQSSGSCGCASGAGVQTSDQSASNDQSAVAGSSATQTDPSNTNIAIRVLSPGNDGAVTQSNNVASSAQAANANRTDQASTQAGAQGRECGCSGTGIQTATQSAASRQDAGALSQAGQTGASNEAAPVRVGSPGNDGAVVQSNTVGSSAQAGNRNDTAQDATQSLAGAGIAIQVVGQDAANRQGAAALSSAGQLGASNDASPVRVDSAGSGGSVVQSNAVGSSAGAGNLNATDQDATQNAASPCGCGGLTVQVLGQQARNEQAAVGASLAQQVFGRESPCGCGGGGSGNSNSPTRVASAGDDGPVAQENRVGSAAEAANLNATDQSGSQNAAGGGAIQVLGQGALNDQFAAALSAALQASASNRNAPTRVGSPGGGGTVRQANLAGSSAGAGNRNETGQDAHQVYAGSICGCHGVSAIQTIGQSSLSEQIARAFSEALQRNAANASRPTRVGSGGANGTLVQGNLDDSRGDAANRNDGDQEAMQTS